MEGILRTLQQATLLIVWQVLDLVSAVADLLRTSSVSLPVLPFVAIIVTAFLLGFLLGRISKHQRSEGSEYSTERGADRVILDLERLTPLGLSVEDEVEAHVMDISAIRPDQATERAGRGDRWDRPGPGAALRE